MTKAKAIKQMHEYDRDIIEKSFAITIAKAFGYTLKDIQITPTALMNFKGAVYNSRIISRIKGVSVYELAEAIARKLNPDFRVKSPYIGRGRSAEYVTEKSLDEIIERIK